MLLEHKKAVIYGAAGAIGGAVARSFAHEGADSSSPVAPGAWVESVAERSPPREASPRRQRSCAG